MASMSKSILKSAFPTSKVGSKGQVTLPVQFRRKFRLDPEDLVFFEEREEGVLVRPLRERDPLERFAGLFAKKGGKSAAQLNQELRSQRGEWPGQDEE